MSENVHSISRTHFFGHPREPSEIGPHSFHYSYTLTMNGTVHSLISAINEIKLATCYKLPIPGRQHCDQRHERKEERT